ncbi:DNA polymerase Y family protein [Kordia jejudonensis]|uniref:DNA polymerase Y family protein n=1 Tax=Kordia jejudonensis TaxID=1348245 RepID=UPI00062924D4|nr:DNA polymerase IV [Kordia jejudonensis]
MEKSILHLDLDAFFVSCERLRDSSLKNKPLLVGGLSDRGVVAASSYETRAYGIYSGMSMKMARAMCPEAICIKGDSGIYSSYSNLVTDVIRDEVPLFEKTSIDEFYVDLSGMDKFFGNYKYAKELRTRIINETGLPISFGLSQNKVVSKVATGEAKPNNELKIDYGYEKPFLAPLSIRKIPMVGNSTSQTLQNLGIYKIRKLQEMPLDVMKSVLGKNGETIWRRAQGIDNTPVVPYTERKSISTERTYEKDTTDVLKMKESLIAMAEKIAYQLRMDDRLTACITLKIKYSDHKTYSKQKRIAYTSSDDKIISTILDLFKTLYNRRILVRLIGVKASHLVKGCHQIDLFDDNESLLNLYSSMDTIRNRFGASAIMRASAMDSKSIRSNRNPFNGEPPIVLARRKQ